MERKLAAILAADVVGYSRLMGDDEVATLGALKAHRKEILEPKEAQYNGRTFKLMGDGALMEFSSVVEAVQFAIDVQLAMRERNASIPDERQIVYRIGINLGDVIVEDDDIFGDGVNVAARLEGLSVPGGICISRAARDQVRDRMEISLEDMGEIKVKNIDRPVRCFTVKLDDAIEEPQNTVVDSESVSALPDKPSIAVLPFENMSGDPDQEYFADGMTEDIITTLSRFRSLFVTARNSSFAYKGTSPDVRQVARDLGVRYVLEGSIRSGGKRIRITGQLIDALTGNHLWAERYDRDMDDIFEIQDEVTVAIVAAIAPEISTAERDRAARKSPDNLDAWGLYQQGLAANYSSTDEGIKSAIELFDRANEMDPRFAPAFAMATNALTRYAMHFMPDNRAELLDRALDKARRAVTLDPQDSTCLWLEARAYSLLGQHDIAISKGEEAAALNPSDAMTLYGLGAILCSAERAEEAIPHIDEAMQLSPRDIFLTGMQFHRALALFDLERYDEACEWGKRACLGRNPRPLSLALLTAILIKLRRGDEAQTVLDDLLTLAPETTCGKFQNNPMFGGAKVLGRLVDALREAGLPE